MFTVYHHANVDDVVVFIKQSNVRVKEKTTGVIMQLASLQKQFFSYLLLTRVLGDRIRSNSLVVTVYLAHTRCADHLRRSLVICQDGQFHPVVVFSMVVNEAS